VDVTVAGLASDSLGVRRVGNWPFAAAQAWVSEAVAISDDAIACAQRALWRETRLVVEPGGAAALAALLAGAYVPESDERVAVLVCGANTDPRSVT
jgi:threonine dehydratase